MRINKSYLLIVTAWVSSGLIIFLGQIFTTLGLSVWEIAILPFIPILFFLIPVLIRRKQRLTKKNIWPLMVFGFVAALVVPLEFGGLYFDVPVAIIVLLLYTQPLWLIILGPRLLHERIQRYHMLSCIFVLWWIFLLVYPFNAGIVISPIGIAIWLLAGITLSFWVVCGAWTARKGIDPYLIKFSETGFSILFLFLFYLIFLLCARWSSAIAFTFHRWRPIRLLFLGFALFAQILPHVSYLKWIKKVPAVSASIILLLEPLVAVILATLFLHQPLTRYIITGWILILLWNVFVMVYGQKE